MRIFCENYFCGVTAPVLRENDGHGSRNHPSRESRRPNAFATCGGSQACASSSPRRAASVRAASCNISKACQRSRGVPARGSRRKYASDVSRNKIAPTISRSALDVSPTSLLCVSGESRSITNFVRKSGFVRSGNWYGIPCAECNRRSDSRSAAVYSRMCICSKRWQLIVISSGPGRPSVTGEYRTDDKKYADNDANEAPLPVWNLSIGTKPVVLILVEFQIFAENADGNNRSAQQRKD